MAELETLIHELPQLVHNLRLTIGNSQKIMEEVILINSIQEQLRNIQKLIVQELRFAKLKNGTISTLSRLVTVPNLFIASEYLVNVAIDRRTGFINAKFGNLDTVISLNDLQIKVDFWIEWGYLLQAVAIDILSDSQLTSQLDSNIDHLSLPTTLQNIDESLKINLAFHNFKLLQQQSQKLSNIQEELLKVQHRLNYIITTIKNSQSLLTILQGISCFYGKSGFILEWFDDEHELIISSNNNFQELTDILNACDDFKDKLCDFILHSNSLKEQAEQAMINADQEISKETVINQQLEVKPKFLAQKLFRSILVIASSLIALSFGNQLIKNQNLYFQQKSLNSTQEISATANFKSAQNLGMEAAALVQNPPHSLTVWQQAETKWQQAVNLLENIPEETSISIRAKKQLATYRVNYTVINKRLLIEKQAVANLESSQKLAIEASFIVQNSPHSILVWQQAKDKWEQAINLLEDIPEGTSVSIEAQETLIVYKANYAAISTRIQN